MAFQKTDEQGLNEVQMNASASSFSELQKTETDNRKSNAQSNRQQTETVQRLYKDFLDNL